jgi:outer membrane protein assembly factor BamB
MEQGGLTTRVIFHNHLMIVGVLANEGFHLYAFDKNDGTLEWETQDFHSRFDPFGIDAIEKKDDKLFLSNGPRLMSIDANTGNELWYAEIENGLNAITLIDNWIYKVIYMPNKTRNYLLRFDINSGQRDTVTSIQLNKYGNGYSPKICMPVKWNHPNGDEILIMQNRTFGWYLDQESKMDLFAYNLTADSMFWYRDSVDSRSSQHKPAIDGDNVYFYGYYHAYCIDPATGDTKWKFNVARDNASVFATSNIVVHNDVFLVKPENDWMFGLDKTNGKEIWSNSSIAPPGDIEVHNNMAYFGSYHLYGVDTKTGEVLIDHSPENGETFINPIGVDPETGLLYTSDTRTIYCFDPEKLRLE